jgi:hypothetical protein
MTSRLLFLVTQPDRLFSRLSSEAFHISCSPPKKRVRAKITKLHFLYILTSTSATSLRIKLDSSDPGSSLFYLLFSSYRTCIAHWLCIMFFYYYYYYCYPSLSGISCFRFLMLRSRTCLDSPYTPFSTQTSNNQYQNKIQKSFQLLLKLSCVFGSDAITYLKLPFNLSFRNWVTCIPLTPLLGPV